MMDMHAFDICMWSKLVSYIIIKCILAIAHHTCSYIGHHITCIYIGSQCPNIIITVDRVQVIESAHAVIHSATLRHIEPSVYYECAVCDIMQCWLALYNVSMTKLEEP